jgi:hypothetical protein
VSSTRPPTYQETPAARPALRLLEGGEDTNGQREAKRPPPLGPLTPLCGYAQARPPGRPVQVMRAAACKLERAAPAGGTIREPPALMDRLPDRAFVRR